MISSKATDGRCPRCHTAYPEQYKRVKGVRPGWECGRCGLFFAEGTWALVDGVPKRRFPKQKAHLRSYVDSKALWGGGE